MRISPLSAASPSPAPQPAQALRYASSVPSTLATISSAPRSDTVRSSPGATSPARSSAIHVGVGAGPPLGIWIWSSPGDGAIPRAGAAATPSTSRPARSGAASSSASLIASSSVAAEAGHPSQCPTRRRWATPSCEPEQLDVAAMGLHVRTHRGERLAHPCLEVDRVEVVDEQQARDDAVLHEPVVDLLAGGTGGLERLDHPPQALAVELDDRPDKILGDRARVAVVERFEGLGQLLDPRQVPLGVERHPVGCGLGGHQQRPVGRCTTFRTRPAPVYMCTPHGRHGSNDRTARMMSTPLKFSGPFSSKIGVFCTESS